jgi:transmembrane sensor
MKRAEQPAEDELQQQALYWHAATRREDCDWQGFTEWLEAAPRHRMVFDEVALLEERIARHAAQLRTGTAVPAPFRRSSRWVLAATIAVLAVTALLGYRLLSGRFAAGPRSFSTQALSASVALAGGMQVVLAPGSTLQVDGRRDDRLVLRGAAWFDVPHDPRRLLIITAGDYQLRDIGTRFEVVSDGKLLKVAVADGELAVRLPGAREPLRLPAGRRLLVAGDPPIAETGDVAADDMAGWREGRLVFRNEPLSLVALQVGRHAGLDITMEPAVARLRFSGVLTIGDGTQLVEQLARIMGLHAERSGAAVHLAADGQPAGR